jgi:hypothetical protein
MMLHQIYLTKAAPSNIKDNYMKSSKRPAWDAKEKLEFALGVGIMAISAAAAFVFNYMGF